MDKLAVNKHSNMVYVLEDGAQFDVRFLKQFVNPVDMAGSFLFEVAAITGQITQVALELWGNEGGCE